MLLLACCGCSEARCWEYKESEFGMLAEEEGGPRPSLRSYSNTVVNVNGCTVGSAFEKKPLNHVKVVTSCNQHHHWFGCPQWPPLQRATKPRRGCLPVSQAHYHQSLVFSGAHFKMPLGPVDVVKEVVADP